MIVFRYLSREVLLSMLAVTAVLLVIIMSGRLVSYLAQVASGSLDADVLLQIIVYRLPDFLQLILPLGLFLGFLLGYGRLYLESEMTVLEACGMSHRRLLAYAMGPAVLVALCVAVLSLWLAPLGALHSNLIFDQQKQRGELDALVPGRFQQPARSPRVVYTESLSETGRLGLVFSAERNPQNKRLQITLAEAGQTRVVPELNERYLVLEQGRRYEGVPGQGDFTELRFAEYGTLLPNKTQTLRYPRVEALPTGGLFGSDKAAERAQLHWRLSLPVLALVVTMLAVPLSRVNPRQGRYGRLVPSIVIYLVYLAILSNVKSQVAEGDAPSLLLWLVHFGFILLALNMLLFGRFWRHLFDQVALPSLPFRKGSS
ncbi:LPS export ABC transporter permease LptF [Pontibacter sp. JAM-7]|uniref:LPS export ABC transporter permease LptF n=1 Tax=Pontibacter sp. JAM-7 TaxID=3366581 RepID=UPI003AF6FA8C